MWNRQSGDRALYLVEPAGWDPVQAQASTPGTIRRPVRELWKGGTAHLRSFPPAAAGHGNSGAECGTTRAGGWGGPGQGESPTPEMRRLAAAWMCALPCPLQRYGQQRLLVFGCSPPPWQFSVAVVLLPVC